MTNDDDKTNDNAPQTLSFGGKPMVINHDGRVALTGEDAPTGTNDVPFADYLRSVLLQLETTETFGADEDVVRAFHSGVLSCLFASCECDNTEPLFDAAISWLKYQQDKIDAKNK